MPEIGQLGQPVIVGDKLGHIVIQLAAKTHHQVGSDAQQDNLCQLAGGNNRGDFFGDLDLMAQIIDEGIGLEAL